MPYQPKLNNRPSGKSTSPAVILNREQVAAALELRKRGKSFQEIADICGWSSKGQAQAAVELALESAIKVPATQLLDLEVHRLDTLQESMWDLATTGGDVKAALVVLKIMERRAKLLGLDKPTETKTSTTIQTQAPTPTQDQGTPAYLVDLVRTLQIAGVLDMEIPGANLPQILDGTYQELPSGQ